jgi:hypothetical protein
MAAWTSANEVPVGGSLERTERMGSTPEALEDPLDPLAMTFPPSFVHAHLSAAIRRRVSRRNEPGRESHRPYSADAHKAGERCKPV